MDRPRSAAGAGDPTLGGLAERPMRPASEQRLVHAPFVEQAPHRLDMDGITAMGRARDRELRLAKRESVRGIASTSGIA